MLPNGYSKPPSGGSQAGTVKSCLERSAQRKRLGRPEVYSERARARGDTEEISSFRDFPEATSSADRPLFDDPSRVHWHLICEKLEHSKMFCLTVSSGDKISVVINDPKIKATAEIESLGDGAIANIRAMLRQYKVA